MKKISFMCSLSLVISLGIAPLWAADAPRVFAPTSNTFKAKQASITHVHVQVQAGLKDANPQWRMPATLTNVLITRMLELPNRTPQAADNVWKKTPVREPLYRGVEVNISLDGGDKISAFKVFEGAITSSKGRKLMADPGRTLEYWLMGTARIKRDQLLAARVLPILSFEQCRLLSNQIVETTPRQCLLPDGNLLLDTPEQPTTASLKAVDFDTCLTHGKALIQTFPRRCMAAGGRVFTEPPRVYEAPADAPLASVVSSSVPNALMQEVSTSVATSPTAVLTEVVSRTGLGRYTVSATLTSPTSVSSSTAISPSASPSIAPSISPSI